MWTRWCIFGCSLVAEGYYVVGITRRSSQDFMWRHEALNLTGKIDIRSIDVTEQSAVLELFQKERFDEVYNLAAQSFVGASWDAPVSTTMVNSLGVLYLLEAIKRFDPETKMYQASTSEMFGLIQESVQNEDTKLYLGLHMPYQRSLLIKCLLTTEVFWITPMFWYFI